MGMQHLSIVAAMFIMFLHTHAAAKWLSESSLHSGARVLSARKLCDLHHVHVQNY